MVVTTERELLRLRIMGLVYGMAITPVVAAFCALWAAGPWWERGLVGLLGLAGAGLALAVAQALRRRGFAQPTQQRSPTVRRSLQAAVGSDVDLSLRNSRLTEGRFQVEAVTGNWVKLTSPRSSGAAAGGRGPGWTPIRDIERASPLATRAGSRWAGR